MGVLPICAPEECGRNFRSSLKKPSPNYTKGAKTKIRVVPAFTIQALQKNTRVIPPEKSGVFDQQPVKETNFRKCYLRGEFPVSIEFTNRGKLLKWSFPVEKLDFHHYLPMFFDGLAEGGYPFSFIVEKGIQDLIRIAPYKVLPVIPQLIIPIKNALATKQPTVMCYTLRCIQMLVKGCERVGVALVPYYRQILPCMNLYLTKNRGPCDVDQIIVRDEDVRFIISDTLQVLEMYGGPDAFINIKYMIPTYESCMLN